MQTPGRATGGCRHCGAQGDSSSALESVFRAVQRFSSSSDIRLNARPAAPRSLSTPGARPGSFSRSHAFARRSWSTEEQRGERQQTYSARCAVSSRALLRQLDGPERAELVDQPLTRGGTSQLDRVWRFESVAAARSPLMVILSTVAPRCSAAHLRVFLDGLFVLLAGGPAKGCVVVAGLSGGGEHPRPVVGGLGDQLLRCR